MDLVLGIDLGTSYFKMGLFDRDGRLCGLGRVRVPKQTEGPGVCELPAGQFWQTLKEGLTQALDQCRAHCLDIKAISYSSQANSFLLLDGDNQPLTPLILWPDQRGDQNDRNLTELWAHQERLVKTGLVLKGPEFCIAKLLRIQNEKPALWSRVRRIMTISDYLVFGLTGKCLGDMGTASLLGTWDLQDECWWNEALQRINISESHLSTPLRPGSPVGHVTVSGAALLGLPKGIPLAVGSLDHHMAAIGAGVGHMADVSESTGTVIACLRYLTDYQPRQECCMGPAHTGSGYYQLAYSNDGTETLDWYQRIHAPTCDLMELNAAAATVPPGAEGLWAKPQAHTYSELTGFVNRTDKNHHGHFVRAIMESKAGILAELIHTHSPQQRPTRIIATGGGSRSDLWLQIKAHLLGAVFVAPVCEEPACLGAAMFAAIQAQWFDNDQRYHGSVDIHSKEILT